MYLMYALVSIATYLLGCFSTSYLVSMRMGKVDIRTQGSGNAGSTNVYRVLGAKAGAITFLGDVLKAVLAVLLGRYLAGSYGAVLAGIFVVVGHNWPVFLKFKGGKGIASTIGAMLVIHPLALLIIALLGIGILYLTRYVSLASVVGVALFPIVMVILKQSKEYIIFSIVLALMAIWRHRSNIERLLKGTESKLGSKSKQKLES